VEARDQAESGSADVLIRVDEVTAESVADQIEFLLEFAFPIMGVDNLVEKEKKLFDRVVLRGRNVSYGRHQNRLGRDFTGGLKMDNGPECSGLPLDIVSTTEALFEFVPFRDTNRLTKGTQIQYVPLKVPGYREVPDSFRDTFEMNSANLPGFCRAVTDIIAKLKPKLWRPTV
jgi:hypothetical protein